MIGKSGIQKAAHCQARRAIILLSLVLALVGCNEPKGQPIPRQLKIANEIVLKKNEYNRKTWGSWTISGGCSTREQQLKKYGTEIKTDKKCTVISGKWTSLYDNFRILSPAQMQVDHIVPLKEAEESGARGWSPDRKNKFYNDKENLIAVSGTSNQSKSDRDPAEWLPTNKAYVCEYVDDYVEVKEAYDLAFDSTEASVIQNILKDC